MRNARRASLRTESIIIAAAVAGAIFVAAWLAVTVVTSAVNVPYWDEWDWTPLILRARSGRLGFYDLWKTHNEHRMLFPNLIALALDRVFGWNQIVECSFGAALAIVTQIGLARLFLGSFSRAAAAPLWCAASFLLFSPLQAENWLWGFQIAWFLIGAMLVAAMLGLSQRPLRRRHLATAALCACIAAYSSAFGLCTLAAGLTVLGLRPDASFAKRRDWTIFACAVFLVYFSGTVTLAARPSSATAAACIAYFFTLIGAVFGSFAGDAASEWIGIAGVAALVICSYTVFVRRDPRVHGAAAPFAGLAAYGVSAAVLTSAGRASFGVHQALAGRYVTTANFFWIGLFAIAALAMSTAGVRTRRTLIVSAALAAACAGAYACDFAKGLQLMHSIRIRNEAGLAAVRAYRTASDRALAPIYPTSSIPRAYMVALSDAGDGPRPNRPPPRSREPFDIRYPALGAIARAHVIRSDKSGFRVSGWAADPVYGAPGRGMIAFVDGTPDGAVRIAYGLPRQDEPDADDNGRLRATGFTASVPAGCLARGKHDLQLVLLNQSGRGYYSVGETLALRVGTDLAVGERGARARSACPAGASPAK